MQVAVPVVMWQCCYCTVQYVLCRAMFVSVRVLMNLLFLLLSRPLQRALCSKDRQKAQTGPTGMARHGTVQYCTVLYCTVQLAS